jgi:pimeloyl-ACP methyl ester carboxylesterase
MAARELSVRTDDGVTLRGEDAGDPAHPAIVLLHGLTATRRYVVMGSRLLERSGYRVVAYDARAHGQSSPAGVGGRAGGNTGEQAYGEGGQALNEAGTGKSDGASAAGEAAYGYERLAHDLETVLDALKIRRAALVGASMGAQTALRFALSSPQRVAALGLVTPAFDPEAEHDEMAYYSGRDSGRAAAGSAAPPEGARDRSQETLAFGEHPRFDQLAQALRADGVEGFVHAYDFSTVPPAWRETVERVVRQRLSLHAHPRAVADAMEVVSRSRPFANNASLAAIAVPTVVIASRDEVDPGHPLALAERYARAIPGATLTVEEGGVGGHPIRSPIAWQGGQLSKVLVELLERARWQ